MKKRIILLVEDQSQVDDVLVVLATAEEDGYLDFSFGTTVEDVPEVDKTE